MPSDTKLQVVEHWYSRHFHLELNALTEWAKIDELRLVANAIKHAEGSSAEELRKVCPELFRHPLDRGFFPDDPPVTLPVCLPLAGEDLYITEQIFRDYCQAALQFMEGIAAFFDEHADEGFGF